MVNDSKRPPVSNNNDDGSRVDVGGQEGRRGHYPTMGDLVLDVDSFLDSDDAAAEDIPPDENDPDDEEEEEEEEYTTQLPDETDDPDSTLTVIQPRQRRARSRNRDIVQQEPTGNASVSSALGSWMSSYARSTGFVEEAAAPTAKKLRNVASMDEAWLAVQGTAEGGEEFVVPEVVLVDAPECMGGGEDLIASVTSYGTLVGDDADSEAPSEKYVFLTILANQPLKF
ncbi:hypothetical protein DFS34DRAFT_326600 [Phlyctochytrium arcticum]|nr:hypothetical protein DFS34DRAFT_326600 [Phlyctochytrium arcticum]